MIGSMRHCQIAYMVSLNNKFDGRVTIGLFFTTITTIGSSIWMVYRVSIYKSWRGPANLAWLLYANSLDHCVLVAVVAMEIPEWPSSSRVDVTFCGVVAVLMMYYVLRSTKKLYSSNQVRICRVSQTSKAYT